MHLRLSYINMMPFIQNHNGTLEGFFIHAWKALAQNQNFTYSFSPKPHGRWGVRFPNGTWDAHLGDLQNNKSDIALGMMVLTEERAADFDYLEHYKVSWVSVLASTGQAGPASFLNFLYTFEKTIWISLLSSFVVLILVSALKDSNFKDCASFLNSLCAYFWVYLASLLLEGSFRTPKNGLVKILLAIWLMAMLVLMNGFCGQFKALLMTNAEEDIFRQMSDLLRRPEMVVVFPFGTAHYKFFSESDSPVYKKIYENSVRKGGIVSYLDYERPPLYQSVKDGKTVVAVHSNRMHEKFCNQLVGNRRMYFIDETVYTTFFAFAVRKDFPKWLAAKLNQRIMWLREKGLFTKWEEMFARGSGQCEKHFSNESTGEDSLTLSQLLPVFGIGLVAQMIPFLRFLWEYFAKKTANY